MLFPSSLAQYICIYIYIEGLLSLVFVTVICVIIYTTDNFLHIVKLYLLARGDSCRLPIAFANSLDPGHVGPDLGPNCSVDTFFF